MELIDVERMARTLMTEHGLGSLTFAFDSGKRRLGAMHSLRIDNMVIPKKITVSKHYAVLLREDEIRDVILHEIAHALTPGHKHNAVFMNACRRIGAKAQRCATPSAAPEPSIVATCPCGVVVSKGHRLPRAMWIHRGCRKPLTYTRNGRIVSLEEMPMAYRQKYDFAVKIGQFK